MTSDFDTIHAKRPKSHVCQTNATSVSRIHEFEYETIRFISNQYEYENTYWAQSSTGFGVLRPVDKKKYSQNVK